MSPNPPRNDSKEASNPATTNEPMQDHFFLVLIRTSGMTPRQSAEVFEDFRIEDRGADLIDTHGPLAEVDLATAVRAEREVFVLGANEHAAGGAAQNFDGFFLCRHWM